MFKFKVNDTVKITAGKDKNQTGKVVKVLPLEDKIVVEGKNTYKKHIKKQGEQAGHIATLSRPLSTAAVALVCPSCGKPTRVQFDSSKEPKVRVCAKCSKPINVVTK
ncbi:50S ribosomal protein L24 [Candidatus Collierbacteria bacterium RIFCSPLOWO2_01_FULL_50_23]|uniref:Large ribosomal subunit protein uL24 n=1 Tax=Candidatus Collierbacteria bacterium RIFCSPHIGHO2_01_FULL_50_25 TaxID=1817722 RepID=A0A1F5EW79_9BACT|nr:ribosomal protein L24 [uncultured bacterium]OGD71658.1 MAG: 50S ribosomal protein L24 [Candidatus Collierbacteria bacterium RIFCSPHIGHO2_01_FULL_50_25]OGD73971.1 MAG: 50S ribosomal protein L24 [Candidatus Collierbacteria bacterium RIFCSPLOWO2_01_FULL_50_23]